MTVGSVIIGMKLVPKRVQTLSDVIDVVKDILPDAVIVVDEDGVSVQGMDSSHIAFVRVRLRPSFFGEFDVPERYEFGVHVGSLAKLLKLGHSLGVCEITDGEDSLAFCFSGPNKTLHLELGLLDMDAQDFNTEDWNYDLTFRMHAGEFQKLCRDMNMFTEQVDIKYDPAKPGQVAFSGTTTGSAIKGIETLVSPSVESLPKGSLESSYSLKHLCVFARTASVTTEVVLRMGKMYPIKLHYSLDDDGSEVSFFLASRMAD